MKAVSVPFRSFAHSARYRPCPAMFSPFTVGKPHSRSKDSYSPIIDKRSGFYKSDWLILIRTSVCDSA